MNEDVLKRRKALVDVLHGLMETYDVDDRDLGKILEYTAEQVERICDPEDPEKEEERTDPFWQLPPPDRHLMISASSRWEENYSSGDENEEMCAEMRIWLSREEIDEINRRAAIELTNEDNIMSIDWCVDASITFQWSEEEGATKYECSVDAVPMLEEALKNAKCDDTETK